MSHRNWPHTRKLIQVEASGSEAIPTHMTLQDEIKEISLVNYDKAKASDGNKRLIREVKYIDQDDFLRMCNGRDNTQANYTTVIDPPTLTNLTIRTDAAPTYFTSFDDKTLIFDSYDSAVDSTLQKSKVQVYAYTIPRSEKSRVGKESVRTVNSRWSPYHKNKTKDTRYKSST